MKMSALKVLKGLRDRITLIEYEVAFIKGISTTNAPLPVHHNFQSIINHQFVPMPSSKGDSQKPFLTSHAILQ